MIITVELDPTETRTFSYDDLCDLKDHARSLGHRVDFIARDGVVDARKYQAALHAHSPEAARRWNHDYMKGVDE